MIWSVTFLLLYALFSPTGAIEYKDLSIRVNTTTFESDHLPQHVIPKSYDLDLDFTTSETDYVGRVDIQVKIPTKLQERERKFFLQLFDCFGAGLSRERDQCKPLNSSDNGTPNYIMIHADLNSINIHEAYFAVQKNGQKVERLEFSDFLYDPEKQMLALSFETDRWRATGEGILSLRFSGKVLDDRLYAIYSRSYLYGRENKKRRFLASQFQPIWARSSFPCFDEPDFKASFKMGLTHWKQETALSNMDVERKTNKPSGSAHTLFKPSPPMSVHMVALAVGEFDYIEQKGVGKSRVPVRIYTPPGMSGSGQFALEVAQKSLEWMERYTAVNYPLEKFDVLINFDHELDNSENWGLTFVRANSSLIDSETKPQKAITVGVNVAHIVVHQWFANLVTARTWGDLWLTEMVAAQKAFQILLDLYPEFESDQLLRLSVLSKVLQMDSHVIRGLHPMSPKPEELRTQDQVYSIFDLLTFMKAASLAQTMEDAVGSDKFQQVVRLWLRKYAYSNFDRDDFDDIYQKVTGQPSVTSVYSTQVQRSSYPVIEIEGLKIGSQQTLHLRYHRMMTYLQLDVAFGQIHGGGEQNDFEQYTFRPPRLSLRLPKWFDLLGETSWFKVNLEPDISTYYRVMYTGELVEQNIQRSIKKKLFGPLDRLNVLDDAVGCTSLGLMKPDSLKQLIESYAEEDHGGVVLAVLQAAQALSAYNTTGPLAVSQVVLGFYQRLGFSSPEGQSLVDLQARSTALLSLVENGNQQVIADALKKFDESNGLVKNLYLREPIYAAVALHGEQSQVDKLKAHLEETQSLEEQLRLIYALAKRKDQSILNFLLEWVKGSMLTRETKQLVQETIMKSLGALTS